VLLLLLQVALQLEKVVVADRPHGHVRDGAGRRSRHLGDHQLLVWKESRIRTAGDGQEAAPVSLVLAALLLRESPQPLLPSILL
jgi:hypothetical protein